MAKRLVLEKQTPTGLTGRHWTKRSEVPEATGALQRALFLSQEALGSPLGGYGQEQDHQGPIYLGPQQPDSPAALGHYKGPCHASPPPAFPPVSPQVRTADSPSEGSARASVAAGKDDD